MLVVENTGIEPENIVNGKTSIETYAKGQIIYILGELNWCQKAGGGGRGKLPHIRMTIIAYTPVTSMYHS